MGYHDREIPKGEYGEFSKIVEEYKELLDSYEQSDRILQLCEMADLVGAIEGYANKYFSFSLDDIMRFMNKTKSAFEEGER